MNNRNNIENILESFDAVKNKIENFKPDLLLFCIDFDGTLVKIQKNPYAAYLDRKYKKIIEKISNTKGIYYCVVTGRALEDIKERVGKDNDIIYSGNHGMEIKSFYKDLNINFIAGGKKSRIFIKIIKKAEKDLRKINIPGLIIENKKYSVSLHCRMLSPENISKLKKNVKEVIKSNKTYEKFLHLKRGKKIVEVRPKLDWDKGKACNFIIEKLSEMLIDKKIKKSKGGRINGDIKILKFCAGDDLTDESMFKVESNRYDNYKDNVRVTGCDDNLKSAKALKMLNISAVVGKKKSNADYYLDNYNQTYIIMEKLADLFSL